MNVLTSCVSDSCRMINSPIKKAPRIPRMEPTAAPISVFSVAWRMRSSNRMMQMATDAPSPAEVQGLFVIGCSHTAAPTRNPVKIILRRMTSGRIIRAFYHASDWPSPILLDWLYRLTDFTYDAPKVEEPGFGENMS